MSVLHVDFETRSEVDLSTSGLDRYKKHKSTEIMCFGFAFDDEPIQLIKHGEPLPDRVRKHIESGGTFIAHNAAFELGIWNSVCVPKYGWPKLNIKQTRCTMIMAYALALPGKLEEVAPAVGIAAKKDMEGHRIMLQLSQPAEFIKGVAVWNKDPEKFEKLYSYCIQDVEVEREVMKRLLPLKDSEFFMWIKDQEINERGVPVDLELCKYTIEMVKKEGKRFNDRIQEITLSKVVSATAVAQIKKWVASRGVSIKGLAKADVVSLLKKEIPEDVREVLTIRQDASKSSTAKLAAIIEAVSEDGRVRNTMQFGAANTGRWAGRKIQPHNFPRPRYDQKILDLFMEDLEAGVSVELLDLTYGSFLDMVSQCLRMFIKAPKGFDFIVGDWAAIEARIIAWLAGQDNVLQMFRNNEDVYVRAAMDIFRIYDPKKVSKFQRLVGKVAVLALGFGGAQGALAQMCKSYEIELPEDLMRLTVQIYREKNPHIKQYWDDLNEQAMKAIKVPGMKFYAGAEGRQVCYLVKGSFLLCKLPSGRVLSYPYPKIEPIMKPWGEQDSITYMYKDPYSKKWVRGDTYGGSLAENITQAVASDILRFGINNLEHEGFKVVFHVHDEIVIELPENTRHESNVEHIMSKSPPWGPDLPLAAEVWRGKRYRK